MEQNGGGVRKEGILMNRWNAERLSSHSLSTEQKAGIVYAGTCICADIVTASPTFVPTTSPTTVPTHAPTGSKSYNQ